LDTLDYLSRLSDDTKKDLEERICILVKYAWPNQMDEVSESSWERDVRSDVFGKIRSDHRVRM
jgi:hypothetical protein